MLAIDQFAWSNRWRDHHPGERLLLAGGLLILSLALPPLAAGPVILATSTLAAVGGAGIPIGTFLRVLVLPAGFLLTSVPMLAVSIDITDGLRISLSDSGLATAAAVSARSLAAVSALTLLVLTTPVVELMRLSRRVGVPKVIEELCLLIYHLVFALLDRAQAGWRAQSARHGYTSLRRSIRSLGMLAATLFQRALDRGRRLETGLAARGYDGDLTVLTPERRLAPRRLAAVAAVLAGVILLALLTARLETEVLTWPR